MQLPPQVLTAFSLLSRAGYEAYLVGGAVRSEVRGGPAPADYDIATNALPEQVEAVFVEYRQIETGLKHGTLTVLLDGEPLEITTYRIDGLYADHRRPDSVRFTGELRDDLARRDFTMNAMAYHPEQGLVDPFGGQADLKAGWIRCVGDPNRRFREDALRILRALRFAAVLGLRIEPETASALRRNRALLRAVAAERVCTELSKLLCGAQAAAVLREFNDVAAVLLPELSPMFGFAQRSPYHDRDVWEHTLAVLAAAPAEPVLRWAALLHDVGKPACFSRSEDGTGHFYGHAEAGASMADAILRRLRFDTVRREQITRLIRYHGIPVTAERKAIRRLISRFGEACTRQLLALHIADTLGQSSLCRDRLPVYQESARLIDALMQEDACLSLRDLAVNGRDLLELGLVGRAVGRTLDACLSAVLEERIPNERAALLRFAEAQASEPTKEGNA